MMRLYHDGDTVGWSEWSSLWLRRLLALLSLARPALALSLEGAASVNTVFFFFYMGICFTFWCITCRNLWHGIPEPARSLGAIEGACACYTQTGSGWSHLAIAVHLCSCDSLCLLCQAPHRDMASRTCEGLHPLGAPHPACLWVDQVTLCVMIWEKPALMPSESPHPLALCPNFQPLESLLWVKAVAHQPLSPLLVQRIFF